MAAKSAVAITMASPSPYLLMHSPQSSVRVISKNILSSHAAIYPVTAVTYQGVDVDKEDTRIVFEKVLANLARSAPPVPGFRREKGGKTSKVPRDFLLQILGEDRVTNFVIREIVTSTLADYVKKENLSVKDNKISTTQTADELKSSFTVGTEFGFNATLELEDT